MANEHDRRYRKLFSNPRIMEELLVSFVDESWVKEIDFSKAERMDRSFVTERFTEREADLIWKLRFQGEEVYLYLLIEFQSSVDRFMALRVLRYLSEFYQFLVESHAVPEDRRLPPVFPLVLYNGDARWTASEQLADLIDPRIGTTFMPSFRYFKLAENAIPRVTLERLNNLVAALFMVETMEMRGAGGQGRQCPVIFASLNDRQRKSPTAWQGADRALGISYITGHYHRWYARIGARGRGGPVQAVVG